MATSSRFSIGPLCDGAPPPQRPLGRPRDRLLHAAGVIDVGAGRARALAHHDLERRDRRGTTAEVEAGADAAAHGAVVAEAHAADPKADGRPVAAGEAHVAAIDPEPLVA